MNVKGFYLFLYSTALKGSSNDGLEKKEFYIAMN